MHFHAYLTFNGDCEEAFRYYAKHLGGEISALMKFSEGPPDMPVDDADRDLIMHASLNIGNAMIMASDAPGGRYRKPQGVSVSIAIDDPKEAERIFAALADGGDIEMPIGETFWAERFGMVTDRWGTPWMINCAGSKAP